MNYISIYFVNILLKIVFGHTKIMQGAGPAAARYKFAFKGLHKRR